MNGLRFILLFGLICVCGQLFGQQPNWTSYHSRVKNYPGNSYFTGFMSGYLSKSDDLEETKIKIIEQAKAQLSENIKVSIESNIVNKMSNVNSISLEEFEKVSRSYSKIEVSGLQTDFYIDTRKNEILAFAWVKKSEVVRHYSNTIIVELDRLSERLTLGSEMADQNPAEALKIIYSAPSIIELIEEAQTILVICGLDQADVLKRARLYELSRTYKTLSDRVHRSRKLSLTELSAFMAAALKFQLTDQSVPIQLARIGYRNSEMGSEFSERLYVLLTKDLTREGFEIKEYGPGIEKSESIYQLSGSYWEDEEDELQVILNLYKKNGDHSPVVLAGVEGWTTVSALVNAKLDYKPPKYFEMVEKAKLFTKRAYYNAGAKLEIWTSKGDNGLVFREGERMRILIRMNQVGYVRVVNFWADGTRNLLVDNYYVSQRKVGRIIELPVEWAVACPCGVEFVQGNAQSVAFVPLDTEVKDGFEFISNDTPSVIANSRQNRQQIVQDGGFAVEERLILTTMK